MTSKAPSIPEGLDLIVTPPNVVIRRSWFSWKVFPILLFVIVWDGFLIFWYTTAIAGKNTPWIAVLFPMGHVAVGVGLTYYVLCCFLNKTDITLNPDRVSVLTYPLPWVGKRLIPTAEIRDTAIRTRNSNRQTTHYVVMYVDELNKERKLVTGISERDHSEYIEDQIRRAAGLPEKES